MAIIYLAEEKTKMKYNKEMHKEVVKMGKSNKKTAEEITEKILEDMGISEMPVPIAEIVEDGFGIKSLLQNLENPLEGFILKNCNLENKFKTDRVISVNKNIEQKQQRFVMAHELAHYIYDGHDQKNYMDTYITDKHETPEEKRANEFAANLLMPRNEFLKMFLKTLNEDVNVIEYLSDYFCVTERAIIKRVKEILSFS